VLFYPLGNTKKELKMLTFKCSGCQIHRQLDRIGRTEGDKNYCQVCTGDLDSVFEIAPLIEVEESISLVASKEFARLWTDLQLKTGKVTLS